MITVTSDRLKSHVCVSFMKLIRFNIFCYSFDNPKIVIFSDCYSLHDILKAPWLIQKRKKLTQKIIDIHQKKVLQWRRCHVIFKSVLITRRSFWNDWFYGFPNLLLIFVISSFFMASRSWWIKQINHKCAIKWQWLLSVLRNTVISSVRLLLCLFRFHWGSSFNISQ